MFSFPATCPKNNLGAKVASAMSNEISRAMALISGDLDLSFSKAPSAALESDRTPRPAT